MSCCGKTKSDIKSIIEAAGNIADGNIRLLLDMMEFRPNKKNDIGNRRIKVCQVCEYCTWMTWNEYWQWINENGGIVKFFTEIDHLVDWPLLPATKDREFERVTRFCRLCKCWIPAKAYSKDEKCPNEKW